jgi:MFS transporter, ACS family, glucarate transporter
MTVDPRPTRARLKLAGWLCGLSAVLYLDRICMSQAIKPIQVEFDLSNRQMSAVMMAFTLAYGLFEIPTGRLGDKYGSRAVLTRIVVWWSVFTALTGACSGLMSLIVVRFLFGAGEAGAFPNAARVVSRWYPLSERGRVQGALLAAAQLGAVGAPALAAYLIEGVGWRGAFLTFGLVGVVWAIGFWWWFRDDPAAHPAVNAGELAIIRAGRAELPRNPGPIPWRAVLTNRGIAVLGLIMILGAFFTYFFYTWFPKYLTDARNVDNIRAGWLASLVLAGSAIGVLIGGWVGDSITRHARDPIRARRYLGVICYLSAAGCLFAGVRCDDPIWLALLWCAAACTMHITLPNWWSVAIPQCGRHVGALFGLMNGLGVVGAITSQGFVGVYSDRRKGLGHLGRDQWDPLFDVYVGVLVAGAIAWWSYRARPLPEASD